MAVIAVATQKGGVGKTTATLNLGASLGQLGRKVLLIDVDPQASLTIWCGLAQPALLTVSVAGGGRSDMAGRREVATAAGAIVRRTALGVDLIPAGRGFSGEAASAGGSAGRDAIPERVLAPLRSSYDYILLDCPAGLGPLTMSALAAADWVIIPVQPDYLALQSMPQMLQAVSLARQYKNRRLETLGILLTMVDTRTIHCRQMIEALHREYDRSHRVFRTMIQTRVSLRDAALRGESILTFAPRDSSAEAYRMLAREVEGLLLAYDSARDPQAAGRSLPGGAPSGAEGPAASQAGSAAEAGALPSIPGLAPAALGARLSVCPSLQSASGAADYSVVPGEPALCSATSPPQAMVPEVQRQYCLSARHRECTRHLRILGRGSAGEGEGGSAEQPTPARSASPRRWFWFR